VKRLPPYTIVAVCGILFLSAGMVIITADNDPSGRPTPTLDVPTPTVVVIPTDVVVVQPTDVPSQPVVPPTDVPAQPIVQPTDVVVAPVVPTDVVQQVEPTTVVQPAQPAAIVDQQQPVPTAIVDTQAQGQPVPPTPIPGSAAQVGSTNGGVVVTPVIDQPSSPLGTLPPPSNVSPTAENPVVVPSVVLPTIQPTTQVLPTVAALMQVTGQIGVPLRADYSGIAVTLTLPNGSAVQTATDSSGHFTFANLVAGTYRVDADASGYLSSQTTFTLTAGQNIVLPPAMLIGGDTNLDNKIDLTDAALIAANFDSTSIVAGADLNHDGVVDIRDLTAIGAYFGLVGPTQWKP
jgi:carboxypeptidase family protein